MLRQQELRVVLTARDMAQGGNWLIPHFRGTPRLRKPPLMYWLDATAQKVTEAYTSPVAARIPSVLAGMALVVAVFFFGQCWMSPQAAFLAAITCCATVLFARFARLAETDMTLTLFIMLAVGFAYRAFTAQKSRILWWILTGLSAGLGFMTKGPAGLVLPLAAILAFTAGIYYSSRKPVLSWSGLNAIWIFILVALPWYYYIWQYAQSQVAIGNEIQEAFIKGDHPGSIFYYAYKLPLVLMPWGVLLPFALLHAWKQQTQRAGMRFILWWWTTSFLILTLIPNKQEHYATLLIPASALLIGVFLSDGYVSSSGRQANLIRAYLTTIVLALALAGPGIAIFFIVNEKVALWPTLLIAAMMLATGIMTLLFKKKHRKTMLISGCVILMGWMGMMYSFVLHPLHDPQSVIPSFVKSASPFIKHAEKIYIQGSRSEAIEYYAGRPLIETANARQTWEYAQPGELLILSTKKNRPLPLDPLPQTPEVDVSLGGARCILLRKAPY